MAFFALWYSIRPMGGQFPVAIHVKLTPLEVYWAAVLVTARQLRKVLWIFGVMGLLFALVLVLSWLRPRPGADWYENFQNSKPLLWVVIPKRYLQAPSEVQALRELLSAHLPKFKPRQD
jgi:hypothetical protein